MGNECLLIDLFTMASFIGVVSQKYTDIGVMLNDADPVAHITMFQWFYRNCGQNPAPGDKIYVVESGKKGILFECDVITKPANHDAYIDYNSNREHRSAREADPRNRFVWVYPIRSGNGRWKYQDGMWVDTGAYVPEQWVRGDLPGCRQSTFKRINV